jgi:hypothetical protein
MKSKIKISNAEITRLLDEEPASFEKYIAPILNMANYYAHGTGAKIVGQMTELIQQFPGGALSEWEQWYIENHPEAIENASKKIHQMIEALKLAIERIDEPTIQKWVRDLVIVKSYIGLKCQEAILKKVSEILQTSYSTATTEQESRGIDGFIDDKPVSIKPESYKQKQALPEHIDQRMIYYKKAKGGIVVDYSELLSIG